MTDDELRQGYERAFLAQARSDWDVYKLLSAQELPRCHELHYLQMATEKLAKAYRVRETASPVSELVKHHTGFQKFIRQYLLSPGNSEPYKGKRAQLQSLMHACSRLAAEIEKLAPAVDRGGSPENVEYPWLAGERVVAPCAWSFPAFSLLTAPGGRAFLKLIELSLRDLDQAATQA